MEAAGRAFEARGKADFRRLRGLRGIRAGIDPGKDYGRDAGGKAPGPAALVGVDAVTLRRALKGA
jgi:hypothetical protein